MKFIEILKSPMRFLKDRFFKDYPDEFSNIPKNSGKIIQQDNKKFAVYKDIDGKIHKLSPYCTHLGCIVEWNDKSKRWDCPCHGASYSKGGQVTSGPARKDLEEILDESKDNYTIEILEIEQLTHDVKRFKTTKPDGYSYTPGQATEVAIDKDGFKDKFRPFTFTSLDNSETLEFTIKEYPTEKYPKHTGVTEEIHKLKVGDQLIIKEPVGTIDYEGKGVFIAGGAGITPFIAIFRDLAKQGKLDGNSLIYSNKESRDIIFEDELKEKFKDENLLLTLTREKIEGYTNGRIDKEMLNGFINVFDQYFYICGPSGFENDISEALKDLGADENKIIIEEW